jgi:integrase
MSVQEKKRKSGQTAYYSVVRWQGKAIWLPVGHNRKVAQARDAAYQLQVDEGSFDPGVAMSKAPTVQEYSIGWLAKRKNRTADNDRSLFRLHIIPHSIAKMKLAAVAPRHAAILVEELRAKGLTDKSISNILGVLRVMFGDAKREELTYTQPIDLPKKHLNRRRAKDPEIYQPSECQVLMRLHSLDPRARMLWAFLLYTGMREGEACGRRWGDARDAEGLKALHIATQYGGDALKTDNPRVCPIHEELASMLTEWVAVWPALVGRQPGPDDFIIPGTVKPWMTRSQAYKLLRSSTAAAGIPWRTVHSTRHTFITLAKRGGSTEAAVEKITHNSRGGIVDGYTRQDWEPLCDVVRGVSFDARQHIALPPRITGENSPVSAFLPKA